MHAAFKMTWHVYRHIRSIWRSNYATPSYLHLRLSTIWQIIYSYRHSYKFHGIPMYHLYSKSYYTFITCYMCSCCKHEGVGHSNRPSSYSIGAWDPLPINLMATHIYTFTPHITLLPLPYLIIGNTFREHIK